MQLTLSLIGFVLVCCIVESHQGELTDAIAQDITSELKKKADEGTKYTLDEAEEELEKALLKALDDHKTDLVKLQPELQDDKQLIDKITNETLLSPAVVAAMNGLVDDGLAPRSITEMIELFCKGSDKIKEKLEEFKKIILSKILKTVLEAVN